MTIRALSIFVLLTLAAGFAKADEITLKSGKVITGKITSETDQSYTIRFGRNITLSVAKSDVASVTRTQKPPVSNRPIYRLETPKPDKPQDSPATSTAAVTGAKPAATAVPSEVRNVHDFTSTETLKVGIAQVQKTTRFRTYDVGGKDFASAKKLILDPAAGLGFRDGKRRSPGRTEWEASYTGQPGSDGKWKAVVVVATVTVRLPAWAVKGQASKAESDQWAAFLKDATEHEAGHLEIIHDGLTSFGQTVSNLAEGGEKELVAETSVLFNEMKDHVAKRRKGYDRRERRAPMKKKRKS